MKASVIWCVCLKSLETGETFYFTEKEKFNSWLKENQESVFIGHNLCSFDLPVINRLWESGIDIISRGVDSLVLSYLFKPALEEGHSLEAWGGRLKFPKGDFSDWSKYSLEMLAYCQQDVELTYRVYKALTKKMLGYNYSELSCTIEHKIRLIINAQEATGFYFDKARAIEFRDFLKQTQRELSEQIQKLFPAELKQAGRYPFRRTKDGRAVASYEKHRVKFPRIEHIFIDGQGNEVSPGTSGSQEYYDTYELEEFNIGSPKQRVEKLLSIGWEPTKYTKPSKTHPKGFPQVDEEALLAFAEKSGRKEVTAIAEWIVLQGRASMLDTWLNNLGDDSRIHGRVLTCGAGSRRMVHSKPNCVPLYSQALTRNGWKSYNELVIGEDILAYDMSTKTKKWTPLLEISSFPAAEVYSFGQQHSGKRFYCTKNHSWVVRGRDCKGYTNTEKLVEAQYLRHNRPVKINAPFDNDVKNSKFSLIQQKYDFDWINEICKLSDPELHSMMQGFLLADGCRHQDTWMFAQAEGHLLDSFITLFYLISDTRISAVQKRKLRGPNQRMGYNVVATKSKYIRTKDMSLKYEGVEPVWCPTTKFGTWVMKQGDFISITGNTANIPSPHKAKYGYEVRSLWGVEPNQDLIEVGVDASGLENVCLLHYLNNPKATEVLNQKKPNDIHSLNSRTLTELLGFEVDREWGAKTSFYAFIFGAYPKKLASIVKGSIKDGELIQEVFYKNIPGLEKLINGVKSEFKSNAGRIRCIDGGYVWCPSESAALNYLIQPTGAIVMKLACILLYEEAKKINLWFRFLGNIHDEFQMETKTKDGDTLGKLAVSCIEESARQLGLRIPLTGEYRCGLNWAECH